MKNEKKTNLKKKFMVFSKKKIAAAVCTALLATAGVTSYISSNRVSQVNLELPQPSEKYDENTIYGEAKYVNSDEVEKESSEVIEYEEEISEDDNSIEKSRSEAVSLLKEVSENENSTADKKAEAQGQLIRIANDMEKEAVVKEVLKDKGYNNISVYLNSPGATVSVKSDGLNDSDLAKIRDVLKDVGGILPQNLKIIETKQ